MTIQDQTVEIECNVSDSTPTLIVSNLPKSSEEIEVGAENETDSLLEIQPALNFELDLISGNSTRKNAIFGHPYDLKVSVDSSTNKHFRVHSCFASSKTRSVELISSNGCSLDKSLIENFVYEKKSASAHIPQMFHFAEDSNTVKFECALLLCAENEECKSNCNLKIDNAIDEDAELVSKLLHSNDDDIASSGNMPRPARKNMASTLIYVSIDNENLQTTSIPPTECELFILFFSIISLFSDVRTTDNLINITGCRREMPDDLILLYKMCIALSALFSLGSILNNTDKNYSAY